MILGGMKMYNFDVKYTFENYYEYYKYTLIKSRILKDSIFCIVFFAFAAYIFIDKSAETTDTLGILSIVLGLMFPLMNFATLPILKKQLKAKQKDIDNTRIFVTFNDEEVIYQNLTVKDGENVDENKENSTKYILFFTGFCRNDTLYALRYSYTVSVLYSCRRFSWRFSISS